LPYNFEVRYLEHPPSAPLRHIVECYWSLETSADDAARAHRVLPDGCMDLLFDLRGGSEAQVIGAMTQALVTARTRGASLLGVRFHPGAAFGLLLVPARELRDTSAQVGDVWGAIGNELGARLAEAHAKGEALRVLDQELRARALRARPADPRVRTSLEAIRASRGTATVQTLAAAAQLGERQLERLFDERVGIGPKALARVVRLQNVATLTARGPCPSWAAVAAQAGYADQAHMIREFRALAGTTPAEYAKARAMSDSFNPALGPLPIVGA
jgi:AraC-like DNA-binding protein